jgi:hypothetical protein
LPSVKWSDITVRDTEEAEPATVADLVAAAGQRAGRNLNRAAGAARNSFLRTQW